MLTYVLGAPGSGKSSVVPLLRELLPEHVVLDWDAFIPAASQLAGRDVRESSSAWPGYRALMRTAVDAIVPAPLVLLGVCTPDELEGWPIDAWVLLDCADDERRRRLEARLDATDVDEAVRDAAEYRARGLPVVDATARSPELVASDLVRVIHKLEQ